MATPITNYQTIDGRVFRTEARANEYEGYSRQAAAALSGLRPRPDGCGFPNGGGYIQQDMAVVRAAQNQLAEASAASTGLPVEKFTGHPSWGHRFCDGDTNEPLGKAWGRLCCIDYATGREYGQPYYAANPDKAEQVAL